MAVLGDRIHVAIIDDHPLFREGVVSVLQAEPDIEVVGQGDNADAAIRLAVDLLPDIVLLDVTMSGGGGLRAMQEIAAACPVTKIVMLTASEEEEDVTAALKAGARAYIIKGVPARELVRVLRAVVVGESYVTPTLAASLLAELTRADALAQRRPGPLDRLTERERQILERVADGASSREIGIQLHLSEKTIKHHMTNILQKLQVRSRVQAALLARASSPNGS